MIEEQFARGPTSTSVRSGQERLTNRHFVPWSVAGSGQVRSAHSFTEVRRGHRLNWPEARSTERLECSYRLQLFEAGSTSAITAAVHTCAKQGHEAVRGTFATIAEAWGLRFAMRRVTTERERGRIQ